MTGQAQEGAIHRDLLGADFAVEQDSEHGNRPAPLQRHPQPFRLQAWRVRLGLVEGLQAVDDVQPSGRERLGQKAETLEALAPGGTQQILDFRRPEIA